MSIQEETRGRQWTCWRDYISWLDWDRVGVPLNELVEVAGRRALGSPFTDMLPLCPGPG